jgi:hypothetical protein
LGSKHRSTVVGNSGGGEGPQGVAKFFLGGYWVCQKI